MKYGRIGHPENEKEKLFDDYVAHVIGQLKLIPYREARLKAFEAITRKRSAEEKERILQAVKERWNETKNKNTR